MSESGDFKASEGKEGMSGTLEMLENDMTLEDIIKKLEKEADNLKCKLGPNLTRRLLEDSEETEDATKKHSTQKEPEFEDDRDRVSSSPSEDEEVSPRQSFAREVSPERAEKFLSTRHSTQKDVPTALEQGRNVLLSGDDKDHHDTKSDTDEEKPATQDVEGDALLGDSEDIQNIETPKDMQAIELMKEHNASLEDVIHKYENELSTLKNALGPNLVDMLLSKYQENQTTDDPITAQADRSTKPGEELSDLQPTQVKKGKMVDTGDVMPETSQTKMQGFNEKENFDDEKKSTGKTKLKDENTKEEIIDKIDDGEIVESGLDNVNQIEQNRDENIAVPICQQSDEIKSILSPLLCGDKDKTIEDVIRTLNDDLKRLDDKLGPNLAKSLLIMDSELKRDSTDQSREAYSEESGSYNEESYLLEETPHKFTRKVDSAGNTRTDKKTQGDDKDMEKEDENEQENEGTRVDEHVELAALDRISKKGETVEEIIKKYEDTLGRYESTLGPHLSKAILTDLQPFPEPSLATKETKETELSQSEETGDEETQLEKDYSKSQPPSEYNIRQHILINDKDEDFHVENKRLEEPLRLMNKGKTLEDMLIDFAKEREMLDLIKAEDGSPISIEDITEAYKNQIKDLETDNAAMRQELETLDTKLGKRLAGQLKGKEADDSDKSEDVVLRKKKETLQDGIKDIDADQDTAKKCDVKEGDHDEDTLEKSSENNQLCDGSKERANEYYSTLEAPIIMIQNDQTLEEVIADYEAQLKDMLINQEQMNAELDTLELSLGSKLFKELRELGVDDEMGLEGKENKAIGERENKIDSPKTATQSKSDFEALNIMAEEEKPLANVLEDYQNRCNILDKENQSMRQALDSLSGGQGDIGDMISGYENTIQMLQNNNKEAEKDFEEKHNELQKEIDDLRDTLEKLAQTLRQDFLDDLIQQQDGENRIEALQKMEKENKTLAEVVEEYEDNMKRMEREKAVLQQLTGQSEDGSSMLDTISDYEDSIRSLKDVNKMLNQRIDDLSAKIGPRLTEEITELCDKSAKRDVDQEDQKTKETTAAVKKMEDENITLEEVLRTYEDQMKALEADIISQDKGKTSNKQDGKLNADEELQKLREGLGDVLANDINELDNKTIEDLQNEDKRPFALLVMKKRNNKLTDVIKLYEDYLQQYGILDTIQGESLASELEDAKGQGDISVDLYHNEPLVSEIMYVEDDFRMTGAIQGYDHDEDSKKDDKEELAELRRQLEEEKELKEKYQNDVQDLLNDIVKLKMKNSEDGDNMEDIERQIKEEYETKQENQRLQEKNKELEKEIERLEQALKEMQKELKNNLKDSDEELEKKTSKIAKRAETLEKEIESLENQFKGNDEEENVRKEMDETSNDDRLAELKARNEALKEQLDHAEEAMREAIEEYKEQLKCLETEHAKSEEEKKHELELLNNKLELEKDAHERLKQDYEEILKKEKERMLEDFENDLEREKRRTKKDFEEQLEDFERLKKKHEQELEDMNEKSKKEKAELNNSFEQEKQKLQKDFEEKFTIQEEEHRRMVDKLRDELEDQMATQIAEVTLRFQQEKASLQVNIEKNIYSEEIQKNLDLESDFQGSLNKVLNDHASEIEDIEREAKEAEEIFKQQKYQLLEEFKKEREKDRIEQEKMRQELEATIENMLKEIIKLKHQRKEMRHQHRTEKQNMEELFDNERIEIQSSIERSKNELIAKVKEEHEKEVGYEREKYEAMLKELQEALEKSETKRKEVEELRNEERKAQETNLNNESEEKSIEVTKEIKAIKKSLEIEYEQKLSIEKQRFEETLQSLRREVGNLQEKRKIIQERVYNQESFSAEKHVIEKSIANYKMEVLAKLEGEMAQRLDRERKPLEEDIKELQTENEELKKQRWEMKVQFRREKAAIEEKYEKEKEVMEQNFNKEREEMRKRLEATLQKQDRAVRGHEMRLSKTASPEASPRVDNTFRMLQQENLALVTQNARLETDVDNLTEKLGSMEQNFKELLQTEKSTAERMKQLQEDLPKKVSFKDTANRPAPEYHPPSTSGQDEVIFQSLQEKDHQIHQLLETKRYYESVLGDLCDEAGLFELDTNQVV